VQISYINLARRTDRRAFMDEQFARLGLAATRIEAVTPEDLTEAERGARREHWISGALSDAALCCSLSHHRALNALLATSEPWGLILEDDAVLSTRLPAFLEAFAKAPPKALLVRIEASIDAHLTLGRDTARFDGVGLHRYTGGGIGSAGYLMSREGARMVLDDDVTCRTDIDTAMFHDTVGLARRLRPLQANPGLCVQAQSLGGAVQSHARSDLAGSRSPSRWWQQAAKALHRDVIQALRKAWWRFALGGERTKVPFSID
jgi:glycosyl transferase family 25